MEGILGTFHPWKVEDIPSSVKIDEDNPSEPCTIHVHHVHHVKLYILYNRSFQRPIVYSFNTTSLSRVPIDEEKGNHHDCQCRLPRFLVLFIVVRSYTLASIVTLGHADWLSGKNVICCMDRWMVSLCCSLTCCLGC